MFRRLEEFTANEGALPSFRCARSSPCLALEELVAELPPAALNQLYLFKGFKSVRMKASPMEVSRGFPLPTRQRFRLISLIVRFRRCLLRRWARAPMTPRMQQLCKKKITGRNNFFFLTVILKMGHDWQVRGREIWSTWFSFFRVFYIETVDATVIAGRVLRTWKGLRV